MAWTGYNVDKDEDFEVTDYNHKGNGAGRVTYSDRKGIVLKGCLDIFSSRAGENLYGELTEDDAGATYDVVMDKKK